MTTATDLFEGEPLHFSDWPHTTVPKGPPGVYTIWNDNTFLYVGMSWREPTSTTSGTSPGLSGRLNSHASGRRSGDQFCIYICDRFVIASLSPEQLDEVSNGIRNLDRHTREYIRTHLTYRYITTSTGNEARSIEAKLRRQGSDAHGTPLLNPG